MSKRNVLLMVALVAVLAGVGGWLLGQRIESPAEAAARVAPPPASLISVPVERRELSSSIVTRGTIDFEETTSVDVPPTEIAASVVTRLTKSEGDALAWGDVVVEITGRPVFVLGGPLPMFRTFAPELNGPDVLQFEEALQQIGLDPGLTDGVYDARTAEAVEELYRSSGYQPPEISDAQEAVLEAARAGIQQAERTLRSAEEADPASSSTEADRLFLNRLVTDAESDLAQIVSDRNIEVLGLSSLRDEAASILSRAERNGSEVAEATRAFDEATALLETVSAEWAETTDAAYSALEGARVRRADWYELAAERAVDDDLSLLFEQLGDAYEDLLTAEGSAATQMPVSELVFLDSLPRTVQRLHVDVGDTPEGPVMDVSGSGVAVVASVSAADRALLEVGRVGTLDDPDSGLSVDAEIDFIADEPGGQNVAPDRYTIRLLPTAVVPDEIFSQNLRLRIPISSTGGDVLSVPLAALSAAANGTSLVEKLIDGNQTEMVEVRVGLAAGGFVEVTPIQQGTLTTRDRVVVGRDQTSIDQPETDEDRSDPDGGAG